MQLLWGLLKNEKSFSTNKEKSVFFLKEGVQGIFEPHAIE